MFNLVKLKKFFVYCLTSSLIVTALIAVVTVIAGDFNDVTRKIFLTLSVVVTYSLASIFFIWGDSKRGSFEKLTFFVNTLFILIILSFATSIFGVWDLISDDLCNKLYLSYLVIGSASLYYDIISQSLHKKKYLDYFVYTSQSFVLILVLMILPAIFIENAFNVMGEMYFRIMAAIAIIVGTLSILTAIFLKLYRNQHPETEKQSNVASKKGWSIWIWILFIYLFFKGLSIVIMYLLSSRQMFN